MIKHLEPRCWDYVITCFEPLGVVTGGIGTYTRVLCALLHEARFDNVLLICSKQPDIEVQNLFPSISFIVANPSRYLEGLELQWLGNEHLRFSFHVALTLKQLYESGHRFKLVEFPDYATEGYYAIKMRRQGLLELDCVAVRLHSPHIMLLQDNEAGLQKYDTLHRHVLTAELYVYKFTDKIYYGVDAMLQRVNSICKEFALDITGKSIKISHPYPQENQYSNRSCSNARNTDRKVDELTVTYIGRLEPRKGIVRFFESLCSDRYLVDLVTRRNIVFELVGKDLPTSDGSQTARSAIEKLLADVSLDQHVRFTGNVEPWAIYNDIHPRADAFVFPSLFENFPNALLETLSLQKPTLVSSRGGMPEISAPFNWVLPYDPLESNSNLMIRRFLDGIPDKGHDYLHLSKSEFSSIIREFNDAIVKCYQAESGAATVSSQQTSVGQLRQATVGFVIPFFNDTDYIDAVLNSIMACKAEGDEIVVVDDMSSNTAWEYLLGKAAKYPIKVLRTGVNSGPSVARNIGVAQLNTDYIQFIDADDMLDPAGFKITRAVLDRLSDLDMVYGLQRSFECKNHYWVPRDSNVLGVLDDNFAHSAVLIRKSVFDALGGYNPHMRYHFEDWEFYLRFCMSGYRGEMVPVTTQIYRVRNASRTTSYAARLAHSRKDMALNAFKHGFGFQSSLDPEQEAWLRLATLIYHATCYEFGGP